MIDRVSEFQPSSRAGFLNDRFVRVSDGMLFSREILISMISVELFFV